MVLNTQSLILDELDARDSQNEMALHNRGDFAARKRTARPLYKMSATPACRPTLYTRLEAESSCVSTSSPSLITMRSI